MQVKQIDIYSIKDRLKKEDKEGYQLIIKLEEALERKQELISKAINKIKELSLISKGYIGGLDPYKD